MLGRVRRVPSETILLGTVVLWSFNFTAIRYGVTHGFEPIAYVALRWAIAAAALTAVVLVRRESLRFRRRELVLLAAAALVGVFLNQIAFSYAIDLATASTVALVFGTLPILVSLLSQLAGFERLRRQHWLATAVSFVGVALVAAGAEGSLTSSAVGILLALATTFTFAVYSVAIVPVMRVHSPLVVSTTSCLIGGSLLLLAAVPSFVTEDWGRPPKLAWGALLYSALGAIVLGNVFWSTAIRRVGAGKSALYANLQPFLGAVFAVLVLSEDLDAVQVVGGLVIASGIVIGGGARLSAAPAD
jgi:drug/metabolite transporter (DMT)-like permease